jgi:hypothetical protein
VGRPSLAPLLTRLRTLQYPGGVRVQCGDGDNSDWYEVMLFPPATEREVSDALGQTGKRLPADFLEFWAASNGANLFVNESSLHGVGVASTELFVELQEEEREFYGDGALERYAVFARVNGAGDFLVLDLKTGRVLDGVHAEQPHEWKPIAESFTQWLDTLIQSSGRYYWIEAMYESAGTSGSG